MAFDPAKKCPGSGKKSLEPDDEHRSYRCPECGGGGAVSKKEQLMYPHYPYRPGRLPEDEETE